MPSYAPRNVEQNQETLLIPYDHASISASTTVKRWRASGRPFRIDRILYINPTGLAEDTTNACQLEIKNGAASLADLTFTVANASDLATSAAHGHVTGAGPFRVFNTGGGLPAGLAAFTNYWLIVVSATTFKFATSRANALAGTAIDLTTDGTGTQTLMRNLITQVFHTDSDMVPDIGASLAVNTFLEFTSDTDVMSRVIAPGDQLLLVHTKFGTGTLPAGSLQIEGRLL